MPAAIAAWRAGFWPSPAARIWPMITSETSLGSTWARRRASMIATSPSLCAGKLLSPPLKAPTGVRVALAITTSVIRGSPRWIDAYKKKCRECRGGIARSPASLLAIARPTGLATTSRWTSPAHRVRALQTSCRCGFRIEGCEPDEFAFRRKGIEDKEQNLDRLDRHTAGRITEGNEPIGGECQALLGHENPRESRAAQDRRLDAGNVAPARARASAPMQ